MRGRALSVLARYDTFDAASEHDCGVFIFAGFAFEWRIEYRGKDGIGLSPDPADPEKTFRCLRFMPPRHIGLCRIRAVRALRAGLYSLSLTEPPFRSRTRDWRLGHPVTIPRAFRNGPFTGAVL